MAQPLVNALTNLLLVGFLIGIYAGVQRFRGVRLGELVRRLGLVPQRRLGWLTAGLCTVAALVAAALVITRDPSFFRHPNHALHDLAGAPWSLAVFGSIFLYGVVQTGFAEELLFRGWIAGVLGRRLSLWNANVIQSAAFTVPHLALLWLAPDQWFGIVIVPFALGLGAGYLRLATGSMLGAWAMHATANLSTAACVVMVT